MTVFSDLPIDIVAYPLRGRRAGLVIVDEVNGFATPGAGPLAPSATDAMIERMILETDRLSHRFLEQKRPILAFLDSHVPGRPEPPYPPHCEMGTGQENFVPALAWLDDTAGVTLFRKDCINGYIGAIDRQNGHNAVAEWIVTHQLDTLVIVGICTDICVMDFVLTVLSARNHQLLPGLHDVVVHVMGCATYDLPRSIVESLRLPETVIHPQALTHHVGLYLMASRGAILATVDD